MAHYLFSIETSDNQPESGMINAASKEAAQNELKRMFPNSVKITLTEESEKVTRFSHLSSNPYLGWDSSEDHSLLSR